MRSLLCLALLLFAAPAAANPDTTLTMPGLAARVRIVTDRAGIVHLEAANLPDLYFAWGFVTARDRLWQLEYTRRATRGRLSEWFGNRALRQDGGAQLFELGPRAERIWARDTQDPELHVALERFCAGINAQIDRCRSGAAPWPRELRRLHHSATAWIPADVVSVLLVQGMVLDFAVPELDEAAEMRAHGREWLTRRRRFEDQWTYATIPDSGGTIHGCYAKSGGSLRVIDAGVTNCKSTETSLDWNVQGQQGPQGPWAGEDEDPGFGARSPEATRSMLTMMQHGWRRGRMDDLDDPEGVPGTGTD